MINPVTELRDFLEAALVDPVVRDHRDRRDSAEALVQRRWISSVTLAVGSFLLALTLRLAPGDPAFYAASLALAATWIVGALLSGRVYLGSAHTRAGTQSSRGVLQAVIVGVLLVGVFLSGAALVAPVDVLRDPVLALFAHAQNGFAPLVAVLLVLNSVGEELFFRGAFYAAVAGPQALLVTTLVYALTAIPTGIPLIVLAAAVLGLVVGLQRRVTGGVLVPVVTHVVWSLGLLVLLPGMLTA